MLKKEEATREYNSGSQHVHKLFTFVVSLWQGVPMTHGGGLSEGLGITTVGMATVSHTDQRCPYSFPMSIFCFPSSV